MQTIKLRSHVGDDGVLHLEVPTGLANTGVEVVIVLQPIDTGAPNTDAERRSWQEFIRKTAGSIPDLEEPDFEGDFEVREPIA